MKKMPIRLIILLMGCLLLLLLFHGIVSLYADCLVHSNAGEMSGNPHIAWIECAFEETRIVQHSKNIVSEPRIVFLLHNGIIFISSC